MSYVIQNFYDSHKRLTMTPRFKTLFFFNNFIKIFFFFKLTTFIKMTNKINFLCINSLSIFFKYFFSKQTEKFLTKLNFNLIGNYTNNMTKSLIFHIFYNFNFLLKSFPSKFAFLPIRANYLYNLYFFPVKVLNVQLNNTFYKNIFFSLLLINPFI